MSMIKLPIDEYLSNIESIIQQNASLVITAEPGAGKSTRVPWHITQKLGYKTIVVEPRRIAAQLLATRVASENNLNLGSEVGYHIRYERRFSSHSKLIYITEGLLKKYIQRDPFLEQIDCVILDEFHERSLNSDIGIMMLKKIQSELNRKLKIIVMSATMDSVKVSSYLNDCKIIQAPGITYPVKLHYRNSTTENIKEIDLIAKQIESCLIETQATKHQGNTLIFLPGSYEIKYCEEYLLKKLPHLKYFPLHSKLSANDIQNVFLPSKESKIILSTNIAETSITLENLEIIIDSGLMKESSVSIPHLIPILRTTRISQASSDQRKGRAGRTKEGTCFRLWSAHEQNFLKLFDTPEVMRADLFEEIIYLKQLGFEESPFEFPWFEKPPEKLIEASLEKAMSLGLVELKHYSNVLNSPASIRVALFLESLIAKQGYLGSEAIIWATILDEPIFYADSKNFESIVSEAKNTIRQSKLFNLISGFYKEFTSKTQNDNLKFLVESLMTSHKDRICRFRNNLSSKEYSKDLILNGGRGVKIKSSDASLNSCEFLLAIELRDKENNSKESFVSIFLPVLKEQILNVFNNEIYIKNWIEEDNHEIRFYEAKYLDKLPLEDARPTSPKREVLCEYYQNKAFHNWNEFIKLNNQLEQTWIRIQIFSTEENYLLNFNLKHLKQVNSHFNNLQELADLEETQTVLRNLLPYPIQLQLDQYFPKDILLATKNRRIPITYHMNGIPKAHISLKLQDAFEWTSHPTVNRGRLPIRVELLSPAGRPIQITEDLINFWKGSYKEIRKEMKSRYPKHNWPENPLG